MEPIVQRRLLLSKEFYLHGLQLSNLPGALNKMVAIHNFHIAIEITLRAIMLQHNIRTEKTLNIDFETMLNEIDNHELFKSAGRKLPYRQELRMLNQLRNFVQHQALEPETSAMEEWRVFTSRFLKRSLTEYFSVSFDDISRLSFIENQLLREILERASSLATTDARLASCTAAGAFKYASHAILSFLPREGFSSTFAAIIATGVPLAELKKFETLAPTVSVFHKGHMYFSVKRKQELDFNRAQWICEFVTNTVISWQHQGLDPKIPEQYQEGAVELANGNWSKNKALDALFS